METKAETGSPEEKNDFLNKQDMDLRLICMLVSLELQYHVEDSLLSTPDKLWTKLEVLFGIKEVCEECMPNNSKTKPT